jgi:hypothetical protein
MGVAPPDTGCNPSIPQHGGAGAVTVLIVEALGKVGGV